MDERITKELRGDWRAALDALDTVQRERSGEHMRELSLAVRALVTVRDRLIKLHRDEGLSQEARAHLGEINSMLSVVASLEYPLAGLHWQRVGLVRDGLERMLNESEDVA